MILIVGLGNPGKKFEKTRHNLGFMTIDNLQMTIDDFSGWEKKKSSQAEISQGMINNKKILLAKPQTFMNNSGKSVKSLIQNYRQIKAMAIIQRQFRNLWVLHDDIDLPLGKIRISISRGAAGHKGVESIIRELKTKDFVRFRIGIKPKQSPRPVRRTEIFVLKSFTKEEEKIVKEVIKKTIEAIEFFLKKGRAKAMAEFN